MVAVAQNTWRSAAARARDFLGIASAITTQALTAEQAALLAHYRASMRRRIDVAGQLRESHNAVVALCLYREAFPLAVAAIRLARTGESDPAPATGLAAVEALRALAREERIPGLPAAVDRAGQLLSQTDLLAFDGDSPSELLAKREVVADAMAWLARQVGRPSLLPVLGRRPRFALAAVAILAIFGAIIGAAVARHAVVTRNLASGQPVTASSRHPRSVAPADNSGLVNGVIEPNYGIHTQIGRDSWVAVDLGDLYPIGIVRVHNRADSFFDEGLPLRLDISEDGQTFTTVTQRTQHFTATDPWVADLGGRQARAVRIHSATYVALTELEVFRAH